MPHQNPATRLREVEMGLGALARELEEITGVRPANLLWWRHELQDVIVTLEQRELTEAGPSSAGTGPRQAAAAPRRPRRSRR